MPRHLTLADIGRGASRHRRPRPRWLAPLVAVGVAVVVGGLALPDGGPAATTATAPTGAAVPAGQAGGGCPKGSTDLVVTASLDTSALLTRLARQFSATGRDAAGRCGAVTVVAAASARAEAALAAGAPQGPGPDVWAPSSSLWLQLLRAHLSAAGRPDLLGPADAPPPRIATSPLVLAVPRPMAEALGWPAARLGWSDVLRLASARGGWASAGHPEWGPFLLGATDPDTSDTGLDAVVAAYHAALGGSRDLAPADVAGAANRRFVSGVQRAVVRYGDSPAPFLTGWLRADAAGRAPTYLSALVVEERLVSAYNDGNPTADPALVGRNPAPRVPLVAVYPKEGTALADHPYAVLSAPWVTDAKRAAAQAFLGYLRGPDVQRSLQANGFRDAGGAAGAQAGPAAGLLPNQPATVVRTPDATTARAVLESWPQVRGPARNRAPA